jgi:hypothetical protein
MIRKRSAVALGCAAIALLTTVPVWLVSTQVPAGVGFAPEDVFRGTFVNVCVVALFAAATLRRTKRTALVLGLIGAAFLIVLYVPFWFIGAGLINVYPSVQSTDGEIANSYLLTAGYSGPPIVDASSILVFMTASMLSVISVVMTLGFAAAALRAERPTQPT